jgi:hypothetical protein
LFLVLTSGSVLKNGPISVLGCSRARNCRRAAMSPKKARAPPQPVIFRRKKISLGRSRNTTPLMTVLRPKPPVSYIGLCEDDAVNDSDMDYTPEDDDPPKLEKCVVCNATVSHLIYPYNEPDSSDLNRLVRRGGEFTPEKPDMSRGECADCDGKRGPYIWFTDALRLFKELKSDDLDFYIGDDITFFGTNGYGRGYLIRSVDLKDILTTNENVIARRARLNEKAAKAATPDARRDARRAATESSSEKTPRTNWLFSH